MNYDEWRQGVLNQIDARLSLVKSRRRCIWQTAEQYRYDAICESIWRWMVRAFIVAGFIGLPIALYALWGMI